MPNPTMKTKTNNNMFVGVNKFVFSTSSAIVSLVVLLVLSGVLFDSRALSDISDCVVTTSAEFFELPVFCDEVCLFDDSEFEVSELESLFDFELLWEVPPFGELF